MTLNSGFRSDHAELVDLLEAFCEGELNASQANRIEQLVGASDEARALYMQYVDLHARLEMEDAAGPPLDVVSQASELLNLGPQPQTVNPIQQTPITGESGTLRKASDAATPPASWRRFAPHVDLPRIDRLLEIAPVAITGVLIFAFGIFVGVRMLRSTPPPPGEPSREAVVANQNAVGQNSDTQYIATLAAATDCLWEESDLPTETGSRLKAGQLQLAKGVAEIHFDRGARVLLEGPATLTLQTADGGFLATGQLVARVPPVAIGFTIETPLAKVFDLGTEFGVHVQPNGELEVHVFEGAVDLASTMAAVAPESLLRLDAGQARRLDAKDATTWHEVAVDERRFVRKPPPRRVFNTGVDDYGRLLKPGDLDSHWIVTTSAEDSFSTPGSAITAESRIGWIANGPNSNSISITAAEGDHVVAGLYVYETTFDLTGLNPSTVQIVGQFSVDNLVSDVLLNGVRTAIDGSGFGDFTPFAINSGFISGVNTLEFKVLNDISPDANGHALRIEMKLNSVLEGVGADKMENRLE